MPIPQQYSDREQITPQRDPSIVLPEIADLGGATRGFGEAILKTAEPYARDRAEKQAIEDAGAASIVKTPEGGYVRANLTHGGGLAYSKVYDEALDTRQLNLMSTDYEAQLSKVATDWADDPAHQDPQQFWSFASGLAQGKLEAAPPQIRAELDTRLARSLAQYGRGFGEAVHSSQRRQLEEGLSQDLGAISKEITNVARSGGDPNDISKTIVGKLSEGIDVIRKMKAAGFIADEGPFTRNLLASTFDERSYVEGAKAMQGLGGNLASMSDEDLTRLGYFSDGTTDGKKVGTMDLAAFRQLFPNAYWQHQAGEVARRVLGERVAAANAKALTDALAGPKDETAGQIEADIRAQNANPNSGLSYEQTVQANQEYATHGPVAQQLRDPTRVQATLGYMARVGQAPIGLNEAVRSLALSSDPKEQGAAFDLIWNARQVTTGSSWSGLQWFNTLPDDVRALAEFDATMRRAGFDGVTRLREILDNRTGRNRTRNDILNEFGKEQDYIKAANTAIGKAFDVKPEELGASLAPMGRDFDRLMTINRDLYPTKEQAMDASAKMLTHAWGMSSVFLGGVGDKKLIGEGIPVWFMDEVLKQTPSIRAANPAGAMFSNGRVKVQATSDSPSQAYPYYNVVFFNDNGERLGRGAIVNMQNVVRLWHDYKGHVQRTAAAEAAKDAEPPLYKIERVNGQVRYVDNAAEYAKWQERMAKKAKAVREQGYRSVIESNAQYPGGL